MMTGAVTLGGQGDLVPLLQDFEEIEVVPFMAVFMTTLNKCLSLDVELHLQSERFQAASRNSP